MSLLVWSLCPCQFLVILIFSSLYGLANLMLFFLVFFFVEKKRFCGSMFLLWGTFSFGVGRCLFACSQMEINKLWAELMPLSNCFKALSFSHPSTSLITASNFALSDRFLFSLSVSPSLLEAFVRHYLKKSISSVVSWKCFLLCSAHCVPLLSVPSSFHCSPWFSWFSWFTVLYLHTRWICLQIVIGTITDIQMYTDATLLALQLAFSLILTGI